MLRYAITDRVRLSLDGPTSPSALAEQAHRLAAAGVDFLQLREKDLEPAALAALARELLVILRAHAPASKLLINSRADVAVATGADGVHLTSASGSLIPADVRRLYAAAGLPEPVVSVSCHTLAEVTEACSSGATLILFGPVFEKVVIEKVVDAQAPRAAGSLVAKGIGLNLLRAACATAAPVPVLALGGVTPENTADCLAAGAAGIAAIRLFLGGSHPLKRTIR